MGPPDSILWRCKKDCDIVYSFSSCGPFIDIRGGGGGGGAKGLKLFGVNRSTKSNVEVVIFYLIFYTMSSRY